MLPHRTGIHEQNRRFVRILGFDKPVRLQMAAHFVRIGHIHLAAVCADVELHSPLPPGEGGAYAPGEGSIRTDSIRALTPLRAPSPEGRGLSTPKHMMRHYTVSGCTNSRSRIPSTFTRSSPGKWQSWSRSTCFRL